MLTVALRVIERNDTLVWQVDYCGMRREFPESQDWAALQLYEAVMKAYINPSSMQSISAM